MLRTIGLWAVLVLAVALPLSAAGHYTVAQADLEETISPLEGNQSTEDFYDYDANAGRSRNPLVEEESSFLFLYQAPDEQVYLFFIHGQNQTGWEEVEAEYRIANVPENARWVVQDDPPDVYPNNVYDLAAERVRWRWGGWFRLYDRTAGGVLGPLGEDFEIHITPERFPRTQDFYLLSGALDQPERISLNPRDTISIYSDDVVTDAPRAQFQLEPVEPRIQEEVVFDAGTSEHDPDVTIEAYHWDFGDGQQRSTTEPRVRHTYMEPGTYEVSLIAEDSQGRESGVATELVYVSEVALNVKRAISTEEATPGSIFRVQVRIETQQDLSGSGLQEFVPAGWKVKPVESGGAEYKQETTQWVFLDPIRAGTQRVVTYDVTVPEPGDLRALRLPSSFEFTGIFQAKAPDFEMDVGGESRVLVTDCLAVETVIAHLVPRGSSSERDRVDLRLSEVIKAEQLDRAGELWRRDESVVDTCGERIDLPTLKNLTAYAEACVPVDRPLPDMPAPELEAVRTISTPIPCEGVVLGFHDEDDEPFGNTLTVQVEITSDVDVMGVGLDEHLPAGWRVTPVQNDGFVYKQSKHQWAYLGTLKAGERRTIIYEVTVPPTTTIERHPDDDCQVLAARHVVGTVDSGWPCNEVDVRGDTRVELTDCLPIIVAISRWDVKEDKIDLLLSDTITFDQLQRAVAFWLEDEEVPHSCPPHKVTYEILKELTALWSTGTPICKELPEATPGPCD